MIPVLAQAGGLGSLPGTPASLVRDVLVILIAILNAVATVMMMVRRRPTTTRIEDQPVQVSASPRYVSEEDHASTARGLADRITRIESVVVEIRKEARVDREHLTAELLQLERRMGDSDARRDENTHGRINDLVGQVARLVGEVGVLAEDIRKGRGREK